MGHLETQSQVPTKRHLHKSFVEFRKNWCAGLLKDYIGGDLTNPELSPTIRNDPVLRQQCERNGYIIIQIGDQLRQVYCNGGQHRSEGAPCPQCGDTYCQQHMAEHLGGNVSGASIEVGKNPDTYLQMPNADMRTEMSGWDDMERERNASASIYRRMSRKQAGEHAYPTEYIVNLPLRERILFEIWAYGNEYGGPTTQADIAVELATRGIDQEYQDKTERYAHYAEEELKQVLQQLVAAGEIRQVGRSSYEIPEEKSWSPPTLKVKLNPLTGEKSWEVVKHTPGGQEHDQSTHAGGGAGVGEKPDYMQFQARDRVKITGGPPGHEGETGEVLYSRKTPGMTEDERQYVVGLGDRDRYGNYPNKVMRTGKDLEATEPKAPGIKVPEPESEVIPTTGPVDIFDLIRKPTPTPTTPGPKMQPMFPVETARGTRWIPFRPEGSAEKDVSPGAGWERVTEYREHPLFGKTEKSSWLEPATVDPKAPKVEGVTITNWEPFTKEKYAFKTGRGAGTGMTITNSWTGEKKTFWDGDEVKNVPVTADTIKEWSAGIPEEERAGLRLSVTSKTMYYNVQDVQKEWVVEGSKIRLRQPEDTDRFGAVAPIKIQSPGKSAGALGGAYYLAANKTLYIGRQSEHMPGGNLRQIFTHETGHHVQDSLLAGEDRKIWRDHYYKSHGEFREKLNSYAASQPEEGWAEAYARYRMDPEYMRSNMPRTTELMEEMLRKLKK